MSCEFLVSLTKSLSKRANQKSKKLSCKPFSRQARNGFSLLGEFDNGTGNIAFRAKFANVNRILRNGETGTVRMNIPARNVMVIPQQSTYEIQDKKYVFVVDAGGYVHARPIKIAFEKQNVYVVTEGLSINDKILVDGVQKVNDGDRISIRYKSPAEVMQSIKLKAN